MTPFELAHAPVAGLCPCGRQRRCGVLSSMLLAKQWAARAPGLRA